MPGLFDLSPFATLTWWNDGQGETLQAHRLDRTDASQALNGIPAHIGLEWDEPRNIERVVAEFASEAPDPAQCHIEYWHNHWPQPDPESRPGSLRAWIGQDDPFHGQWVRARGPVEREGNTLVFTFDSLDIVELPQVQDLESRPGYLAPYRRALKIRLVARSGKVSPVRALHAYSSTIEVPFTVHVRLLDQRAVWQPQVSAYNGTAQEVSRAGEVLVVRGIGTDATTDPREARALSTDATLLTFRGPEPQFTFALADLRNGPLWIKDLGVYITAVEHDLPFGEYQAQVAASLRQPIYERVNDEPEQTYARARVEVPPMPVDTQLPYGRYVVLGIVNGQQKFGLRYNGEVFAGKGLLKLNNRLAARLRWPGRDLHLRFGTGDPPDFRERNGASRQWLEEGYLPIVHTAWHDRDIAYEQTAFAVGLGSDPFAAQRGDEDVVLLGTLQLRNTTTSPRRACMWFNPSPDEAITLDTQGRVLALGYLSKAQYSPAMIKLVRYDRPVLRARLSSCAGDGTRGETLRVVPAPGSLSGEFGTAALYEVTLAPGQAVTLELRIPLASYADMEDWQRIDRIDIAQAHQATAAFWRALVEKQPALHLPKNERDIEDFTRTVPWHILVSASRDPLSGQFVVPAGAYWYGSCGNEAAWQTTALDLFGLPEHGRAYLESMMAMQGRVKPDGFFRSAEGALQAMDFDQGEIKRSTFSYNLDHGTILEAILHHYTISGDHEWLGRFAPHIIAACDFVTRERAATLDHDARTRGLLPPGHLEDNPEWRFWFAVNGHAHAGMQASAQALAKIGHPEAARIRADADAYGQDILAAAKEARILSPVVRLLNGVAVPHTPARAELRGREWGWIREAAYGAIHLWDGRLFADGAPEVTWILQDLEDNLFINREYGYGIDVDEDWFSLGGITPQPNLMSIDLTYLRRNQVKHSLRNFYNNVAYGLYPDVRCLAEWMSEPGLGAGPFYKPSDEARVITWLRHHLVTEEEAQPPAGSPSAATNLAEPRGRITKSMRLHLAKGAPLQWYVDGESFGIERAPTAYGAVSYRVESHGSRITAHVALDLREIPGEVLLRLRHPMGARIRHVTVNGTPMTAQNEDIPLPVQSLAQSFDVAAEY
jgi:hypothetical protein